MSLFPSFVQSTFRLSPDLAGFDYKNKVSGQLC